MHWRKSSILGWPPITIEPITLVGPKVAKHQRSQPRNTDLVDEARQVSSNDSISIIRYRT